MRQTPDYVQVRLLLSKARQLSVQTHSFTIYSLHPFNKMQHLLLLWETAIKEGVNYFRFVFYFTSCLVPSFKINLTALISLSLSLIKETHICLLKCYYLKQTIQYLFKFGSNLSLPTFVCIEIIESVVKTAWLLPPSEPAQVRVKVRGSRGIDRQEDRWEIATVLKSHQTGRVRS